MRKMMNRAAELLLSCHPRIAGLFYVLFAIQLNSLLLKSNDI